MKRKQWIDTIKNDISQLSILEQDSMPDELMFNDIIDSGIKSYHHMTKHRKRDKVNFNDDAMWSLIWEGIITYHKKPSEYKPGKKTVKEYHASNIKQRIRCRIINYIRDLTNDYETTNHEDITFETIFHDISIQSVEFNDLIETMLTDKERALLLARLKYKKKWKDIAKISDFTVDMGNRTDKQIIENLRYQYNKLIDRLTVEYSQDV